jgi:GNAT superfamily N-acetyltransferase
MLAAASHLGREAPLTVQPTIRRLDARSMNERIAELSEVLIDCVEGGASVSFMAPLARHRADAFWLGVRDRVAAGASELLVVELEGRLVGTVQLVLAQPENQPHRADVAKMLVHRHARRRGLGRALLTAAEELARAKGKTLLVLDTVPDTDGDRLYRSLDWQEVGRVPGYALWPDGRPCDTTFFYKQLAP